MPLIIARVRWTNALAPLAVGFTAQGMLGHEFTRIRCMLLMSTGVTGSALRPPPERMTKWTGEFMKGCGPTKRPSFFL